MKNKFFNLLSAIALFSSFFSFGMDHYIYQYIIHKGHIHKQPATDIERILAWKKAQYQYEKSQLLKTKIMETR